MTWLALLLLAQTQTISISDSVTDRAGVLQPEDAATLRRLFADLERTDSTQVVLLTVPTTGGRPIEEFALEVGRSNAIGQKKLNNGVVIVIAVRDRKCRIEVGTGLEGRLTDAMSWHIIRTEMLPHFKEGNYSAGALAGGTAVVQVVRGEYKGLREHDYDLPMNEYLGKSLAWFLAIVFCAASFRIRKRPRLPLAFVPLWPLAGWLIFWMAPSIVSYFIMAGIAFFVTLFVTLSGYGGGSGSWMSGGGSSWGGSSGGSSWSGGGGSFSGGGSSGSW